MPQKKHIWIDLATAPQVQLYRPIVSEFLKRGHAVTVTAREFLETTELARLYDLSIRTIGKHGGHGLMTKGFTILSRVWALSNFIRRRKVDFALGHNSHAQSISAGIMRIPLVIMLDYEHQPAHFLSLRFAKIVLIAETVDAAQLKRFGVSEDKIERYEGLKEDIYLADFKPDPAFRNNLGISSEEILVVMRPPGTMATYHRFPNPLFDQVLDHLMTVDRVKILLFPRTTDQANRVEGLKNVIIPKRVLDGRNAIYWSDLVVGAGGTMNREAAVLGTPAYTVFAGQLGGVDRTLIERGLLTEIRQFSDIDKIKITPKSSWNKEFGRPGLNEKLVDRILSVVEH